MAEKILRFLRSLFKFVDYTAAALAEQLLVSRNTVLKELSYVGKILENNGLSLIKKKECRLHAFRRQVRP